MAHAINVVFSDRTKVDTDRSFYLMGYLGGHGVAFDTSRLENYTGNDRPQEVGAFINGTFVVQGVIMNNPAMDREVQKIRKSQLVQIASAV